jgi:alkylation response protein AidB-like acyl-CoA dehydrogenase
VDFDLTKQQKQIQKAAREFAKGEFSKELEEELEARHEFPIELARKAGELGFIGIHFPEEYGGQGYGTLENALIVEEFCRRDSTLGSALLLCDFASETVLHFGSDEQKQRLLPPIAEGQEFFGGAITEPDHGSDIRRMATTAVRDGDAWVLNGVKTFISNAGVAHNYMVLCQTDPDAAHKGQTMFVVPADAQGLEVADIGAKMGLKLSPTGELTLKDVRVPADAVIGQEGRGFYQVLQFFDESRMEVAAQALGIAQGAFDRTLTYTKKREQFGQKIAAMPVNSHKLADMAIKLELARLVTYKACWLFDQGRMDPMVSSMAKVYAARAAVEVADEAIQLFGGWGYMTDFEVERFYRDAKITEIYEGTREIQKNTIASALLGKLK